MPAKKVKMRLIDGDGIYIERTVTMKEYHELSRWLIHEDHHETVYRTELAKKSVKAQEKLAKAFKRAKQAIKEEGRK